MTEIDPNPVQRLVQRTVFNDPTGGMIQARVGGQFGTFLALSDCNEDDRKAILELLVVISMKCASIWMHDQRYDKRESELIEDAKRSPQDRRKNEPLRLATAQDLYIEFDGFLVQVKSLLDHVVHILHYTHGLDFSGLTTFGDYGNRITRQLKVNVSKKKPALQGTAKLLVEHIEVNQWWLKVVIESRDRMNHYMHGGIPPLSFLVASVIEADGAEKLYRPTFSPGQPVKDEMTVIFKSLLDFMEYFIGMALAARLPGYAFRFKRNADGTQAQWQIIPGSAIEAMLERGEIPPEDMITL